MRVFHVTLGHRVASLPRGVPASAQGNGGDESGTSGGHGLGGDRSTLRGAGQRATGPQRLRVEGSVGTAAAAYAAAAVSHYNGPANVALQLTADFAESCLLATLAGTY